MSRKAMDRSEVKVHTLGLMTHQALRDRIFKVAELSRRKPANVMLMCIEDHLPRMEAELKIVRSVTPKHAGRVI